MFIVTFGLYVFVEKKKIQKVSSKKIKIDDNKCMTKNRNKSNTQKKYTYDFSR